MIKLTQPLFLLLFLLLPIGGYALFKRPGGVLYSSLAGLPGRRSWRVRFLFLSPVLYLLSLTGFILTLARPVYFKGERRDNRKGVILEMVLDRSSSMGTWMDRNKERNRLDIVKTSFLSFVENRPDDIIGLTVFAGYADTLSPPTVSHGVFPSFVQAIDLAEKDADGTAVGDAIALAVGRIESYRAGLDDGGGRDAVIILLTDGQNNRGSFSPQEAAALAAERGITIYTIGFGGGFYQNAFGFWQRIPAEYEVDSRMLTAVAQETGGLYFNAEDESSLKKIYEKIDKLEKTEVEQVSFQERNELFQIFLLVSLVLFLTALFCGEILFPAVEGEK